MAAVRTLASGSGQLVIWDAQNGKTVANIRRKAAGYSVAFSPDSRLLASNWDDTALVTTSAGATVRAIPVLGGGQGPVAFSPTGMLATGSNAGIVQLWNPRTGREYGTPTQVAGAPVAGISFNRTGDTFVTSGGSTGVANLWSSRTLQKIGSDFPGATGTWLSAEYTPDGRNIVVLSRNDQAWLWPASPAAWAAHACQVAGRNLTREEWSRFVGGRRYSPVCG